MNAPAEEPERATVATLETAEGAGGLALLGLSGPAAEQLLARLAECAIADLPSGPGRLVLNTLGKGEGLLDEALIARLPGDESGARFEIGIHGGPGVVEAVLSRFVELGARRGDAAEPGLLLEGAARRWRAEAMALLGAARTELASRVLLMALGGQLLEHLEALLALAHRDEAGRVLALGELRALTASHDWARLLFDPPTVALLGAPNAGKSTLFNALLGEARALTSARPGTTRDFVDEVAVVDGLPLRLVDTAGLRTATSTVESEGMARGLRTAREAALSVLVVDSAGLDAERLAASLAEREAACPGHGLGVLNKIDGLAPELRARLAALPRRKGGSRWLLVSALEGSGLEALRSALRSVLAPAMPQSIDQPVIFLSSQRALVEDMAARLNCGDLMGARAALMCVVD